MNCNKCGSPIEPNMRFCAECGESVTKEESPSVGVLYYQDTSEYEKQAKAAKDDLAALEARLSITHPDMDNKASSNHPDVQIFSPGEDTSSHDANASFVVGESVFQPLESGITYDSVSSNKKLGNKGFIIATIIVVALGIVACLCAVFYPHIMMAVMNPQEYYLMQEQAVIQDYKKAFNLEKIKDMPPIHATGEITTEVKAPDAISQEIFSLFEKLVFTYEVNSDSANGLAKGSMSFKAGDKSYIDMLFEMANDRTAVSVPAWDSGKQVTVGTQWLAKLYNGDEQELMAMTGLNKQQLRDVLERVYKDVFIVGFPKEFVIKDGKAVSFTINETTIKSLADAMHKHMEDQRKVLLPLFQRSVSYLQMKAADGSFAIGEGLIGLDVSAEYDKLMNSLKVISDGAVAIDANSVYTVTYDSRGKLVSRSLRDVTTGNIVELNTTIADENLTTQFTVNASQDSVTFTNNHINNGDIANGDISMTIDGGNASVVGTYEYNMGGEIAGLPTPLGTIDMTVKADNGSSVGIKIAIENGGSDNMLVTVDASVDSAGMIVGIKAKSVTTFSSDVDLNGIDVPEKSTVDEQAFSDGLGNAIQELFVGLGLNEYLQEKPTVNDDIKTENDDDITDAPIESLDDVDLNSFGFSAEFANEDEFVSHILGYDYQSNPDELTIAELDRIVEFAELYADSLS